jgi:MFS family permease
MCGIFFFISLYLQIVRGYTAIEAGAAFLPMTLLICLVAPGAGRISDRIGRRLPAAAGMVILAAGLWLLSSLGPDSSLRSLLPGLVVAGFGIGLTTAPVTTAALDFAPPDEAGVRAGILNTSRMIGLAIGIALMGAIVTARWPGGLAGAAIDPRAFVDGLSTALLVNAAIALVAAGVAALTIAGGGSERLLPERRHSRSPGDDPQAVAKATAPAS